MSDRRFDVFLSHNSKDKPAVLAIDRALQQAGLELWPDAWYLRGGDRWQHVLRDAPQSSTACAFCYGAHGAVDWHELELEVAHDRALKDPNSPLIPVLLPGLREPFGPTSLPIFLSTLMWVDFLHHLPPDSRQIPKGLDAIRAAGSAPGYLLGASGRRTRRSGTRTRQRPTPTRPAAGSGPAWPRSSLRWWPSCSF